MNHAHRGTVLVSELCLPNKKPLPFRESTEKVHNVKWINNWTLLTGLLRNVKLLHIINAKYLRISLIFSILAEKFSYARRLSANPVERICTHL